MGIRERTGDPGLLDRDAELASIAQALDAAGRGRGSVLFVEAPAGLGKTSLLLAARGLAAERGVTPLTARGVELEREMAFGIVRQLLEPTLRGLAEGDQSRMFAGAARLASLALDVELGSEQLTSGVFATLHGLYWLCANLAAERPLLLAVDDAQWSDSASLRFLDYLRQRIDGLPLLLLITSRPAEPGSGHPSLVTLRNDVEVTQLRLRALGEIACAEMITTQLGAVVAPGFGRACREVTGGNPFYLRSLLALAVEHGIEPSDAATARVAKLVPDAVRRYVLARSARFGPGAVRLAQAVAVLGSDVPVHRAATLAGIAYEEAELLADGLAEAQVFRPGRPVEFAHPIVREAIYLDLPAGRRTLEHDRAARQLVAEGRPAEEVAAQLLLTSSAGDEGRLGALRAAARDAVERGAPESAIRYLNRALEEPPGAQLAAILVELGSAENLLGRPEAVDHLHAGLVASRAPGARFEAALRLARALLIWGGARAPALIEPHTAGLEEVEPELAQRLDAELLLTTATEFGPVGSIVRRLVPSLETSGVTAGQRAALVCAAALAPNAAAAAECAQSACAGGLLVGELTSESLVPFTAVWILILADRLDLAEQLVEETLADSDARGSLPGFGMSMLWRAMINHRRGALSLAAEDATIGVELNLRVGTTFGVAWHLGALVAALVDLGKLDDAVASLEQAELTEAEIANTGLLTLAFHRGRLYQAQNCHEQALAEFVRVGRVTGRSSRWAAWIPHRSAAARSLIALDRPDEARALAEEELELACAWGPPRAVAIARHALALSAPTSDRLSLLQTAAAEAERSPSRLEQARSQIDLGAELRRRGERAAAREHLRAGLALADQCGAMPLSERAAEELAAAGARARNILRSGVDSLTPSERRVARMAIAGLTNREIAQGLFVTAKTVESHLRHVYQKLDIDSRRQLARAMNEPAPS